MKRRNFIFSLPGIFAAKEIAASLATPEWIVHPGVPIDLDYMKQGQAYMRLTGTFTKEEFDDLCETPNWKKERHIKEWHKYLENKKIENDSK